MATGTVEPPINDDDIDESSLDASLPADTSETPPSLWSRSYNGEPSFGVDSDDEEVQHALPSRIREYQPSLAEQVHQEINRGKGSIPAKGQPLSWAERSTVRRQASVKAAQNVATTTTRLLGKAGGRLAGAALGNVVGATIAAALTIKDIVATISQKYGGSLVTTGVLAPILVSLLLGCLIFLSFANTGTPSPNIGGGAAADNIDNQELAGLASGEYSIVSAKSVADLQKIRERLRTYLNQNTNVSVDARNRALVLLAQMSGIEKNIKTSAFASEKSGMANHIKEYQKLVNDFYAIVLPNGGAIRAQLLALVDTGVITTNNFCRGTDRDLRGTGKLLTPTLMNTLVEIGKFATANGIKIELSCLNSGHSGGSRHVVGQAADIQYHEGDTTLPSKLLPFLWDNRDRLQLHEIIFNVPVNGLPAGFYNYKFTNPSWNQTRYARGHDNHIHVSTRQ